jgi:simple sugar transport system permease protein
VGVYHALVPDLSASYGYIGIAVALLARLSPIWIIPSAVFFAAVTVGGNNLTATSGISPSTSLIIEAVFIILLLAFHVIRLQRSRAL